MVEVLAKSIEEVFVAVGLVEIDVLVLKDLKYKQYEQYGIYIC